MVESSDEVVGVNVEDSAVDVARSVSTPLDIIGEIVSERICVTVLGVIEIVCPSNWEDVTVTI